MTFLEAKEIANKVLAANKVHYTLNYYAGEPYAGLRKEEMKAKNDRITDLEKEVRLLKAKIVALESR